MALHLLYKWNTTMRASNTTRCPKNWDLLLVIVAVNLSFLGGHLVVYSKFPCTGLFFTFIMAIGPFTNSWREWDGIISDIASFRLMYSHFDFPGYGVNKTQQNTIVVNWIIQNWCKCLFITLTHSWLLLLVCWVKFLISYSRDRFHQTRQECENINIYEMNISFTNFGMDRSMKKIICFSIFNNS